MIVREDKAAVDRHLETRFGRLEPGSIISLLPGETWTFEVDERAIFSTYTSRVVDGEIIHDFRCWFAPIGDEL